MSMIMRSRHSYSVSRTTTYVGQRALAEETPPTQRRKGTPVPLGCEASTHENPINFSDEDQRTHHARPYAPGARASPGAAVMRTSATTCHTCGA
jgi:hypothetical protein